MGIYYLGAFPPGYGGVTIKNQNLYTALSEELEIEKIDFNAIKRKEIMLAFQFLRVFFDHKNTFVIGVSGKETRRRFCKLLYYCNRPAMNRSIIFLMGGSVSKDIAADAKYQKFMREYKQVYVETHGMKRELEETGLKNVGYYPNCRFRPAEVLPAQSSAAEGPLKCVFFSLIQPQKGADVVLEAAKQTPEISYAFYGDVDAEYKEEFLHTLEQLKNVEYYGVFSGSPEAVYSELRKYDILLFPTKWSIEGVPGILVEAKIAGISCIVSSKSYNGEIVRDQMEGIVLKDNTATELARALHTLDESRALLDAMKKNSAQSGSQYDIENYIDEICKKLSGGGLNDRIPARLKAVFFASIRWEKGIDVILDALSVLPDVEFHFYGGIDDAVHAQFRRALCENSNAYYHGVFDSTSEAVFWELAQYDVMLLPTRWGAEGVPGTLVEGKIAGIPAIVSDICYNAEIVEDGVSGIVLKENTPAALVQAIAALDKDREYLLRLKEGAKDSAEQYYIENYLNDIVKAQRGGVSLNGYIFCQAIIGGWFCKAEWLRIQAVMFWMPSVRRCAA